MPPLIVAGISTNVGKTVVSSILAEALHADYWKPIQTGEESDTQTVRNLVSNPFTQCHEECYRFKHPLSPHTAAKLEGVTIDTDKFVLPKTENHLIIEGSGGVMSPLDDTFTQWEVYSKWRAKWVLVVDHYLGSINHTLLSIAMLKNHLIGLIFVSSDLSSENFILRHSHLPCLGKIPFLEPLNRNTIQCQAALLRPLWTTICKQYGIPLPMLGSH